MGWLDDAFLGKATVVKTNGISHGKGHKGKRTGGISYGKRSRGTVTGGEGPEIRTAPMRTPAWGPESPSKIKEAIGRGVAKGKRVHRQLVAEYNKPANIKARRKSVRKHKRIVRRIWRRLI
jgi:hypothetical protein